MDAESDTMTTIGSTSTQLSCEPTVGPAELEAAFELELEAAFELELEAAFELEVEAAFSRSWSAPSSHGPSRSVHMLWSGLWPASSSSRQDVVRFPPSLLPWQE